MKNVDRGKMTEALLALFNDQQPVHLQLSKQIAWQLLSTIQLACRHPGFKGPTRQQIQSMARQLQQTLCANNNDLRLLAEMGWDEQFDEEEKVVQCPKCGIKGRETEFAAVVRNGDSPVLGRVIDCGYGCKCGHQFGFECII